SGGLTLTEVDDFASIANVYWPNLWKGAARPAAEQAYRMALTGGIGRFQGEGLTQKGATKWWEVDVRPMLGLDGKTEKLLVVSRDITEHKLAALAEAERSRLSTLRGDIAVAMARSGEIQPVLQHIAELLVRDTDAAIAQIWTVIDAGAPPQRQANAGPQTLLNDG